MKIKNVTTQKEQLKQNTPNIFKTYERHIKHTQQNKNKQQPQTQQTTNKSI